MSGCKDNLASEITTGCLSTVLVNDDTHVSLAPFLHYIFTFTLPVILGLAVKLLG